MSVPVIGQLIVYGLATQFSLYSELFIINLLFMVYGLCFISLLPKKTISSVKSDTRPDFSVLPLATRTLNNAPHIVKAEISLFKNLPNSHRHFKS